LKQTD